VTKVDAVTSTPASTTTPTGPCRALFHRVLRRLEHPPSFGMTAVVSMGVLAVHGGTALLVLPEQAIENGRTVTSLVLGQMDLLWMWLGSGFMLGAVGAGRWMTRRSYDVFSARWARLAWPSVWAACALFSWVAFWSMSTPAVWVMYKTGLATWRAELPTVVYFAGRYHAIVGVIALLAVCVLALRHRLTPRRVATINALWIASYLGLVGWFASGERVAAADTRLSFSAFWPAVVLLGGVLWSLGKSERNWRDVSSRRLELQLGLMALILGLAISPAGLGRVDMFGVQALATLVGITHLAIPRAIHAELNRNRSTDEDDLLRGGALLGIFVIGVFTAAVCLTINVRPGPHLLIAPGLWLIVMLLLRLKRGGLTPLDAASVGATLGIGFAWAWYFPPEYEIPFVQPWMWVRNHWIDHINHRFRFGAEHLLFVLISALLGMLIGWYVLRRGGTVGRAIRNSSTS